MKCYFLWTVSGPQLILTSRDYLAHPDFLEKLKNMGIPKFIAYEVPIEMVKQRYGGHFEKVITDPNGNDELRVLDSQGKRVLNNISFKELGPAIPYE